MVKVGEVKFGSSIEKADLKWIEHRLTKGWSIKFNGFVNRCEIEDFNEKRERTKPVRVGRRFTCSLSGVVEKPNQQLREILKYDLNYPCEFSFATNWSRDGDGWKSTVVFVSNEHNHDPFFVTHTKTRKKKRKRDHDDLCPLFMLKGELPKDFSSSNALKVTSGLIQADRSERKRKLSKIVDLDEKLTLPSTSKPIKRRNIDQSVIELELLLDNSNPISTSDSSSFK